MVEAKDVLTYIACAERPQPFKYTTRLHIQLERVELLEAKAIIAQKAANEAKAMADKARADYRKRMNELTPKNPKTRPKGLWAIDQSKGQKTCQGKSPKTSRADRIRIEAEAMAFLSN